LWEEPSEAISQNQRDAVGILAIYGAEDVNLICSFKSAAQLLVGRRIEEDLSYLDPPSGGDDAFARPCHRLVHVSGFQYPKTA